MTKDRILYEIKLRWICFFAAVTLFLCVLLPLGIKLTEGQDKYFSWFIWLSLVLACLFVARFEKVITMSSGKLIIQRGALVLFHVKSLNLSDYSSVVLRRGVSSSLIMGGNNRSTGMSRHEVLLQGKRGQFERLHRFVDAAGGREAKKLATHLEKELGLPLVEIRRND